ncbi:hypothetical protein WN943_007362 [Citrus x changshan-huyou]
MITSTIESDPLTYEEAMKSQDVAFSKEAINDEMHSIVGNKTWKLVDLPPTSNPIGCKWIFKKKKKVDGTIERFKARLVAKGFTQKEGLDYFDTYAPVARIATIRVLIVLASIYQFEIHQMDVKTAFLNGELDEKIYMKQPEGFVMPGQEHKVCKLVKCLYGLKQASKQWHEKFDKVIVSNGFNIHESDKCVYSRFNGNKCVMICLYVDDMLIFGIDSESIELTKSLLSSNFDMKDVGLADVILGIKIIKKENDLVLTIEKILKKFNYYDCKFVSTPFDSNIRLYPNTGISVFQLEYARYTAIASIDDLLMYGMGMGLFQGVNKMQVARARAHGLVHKLKACCMFSMHDVVRDVAISIASTEQNVFSATEEQTNLLLEVVECPQLELLFICADKESSSLTIPNKFFERMIQVRVINFSYMNLLSLPSSLGLLSNLQNLSLYNCKLLDITVIRDLKKLAVLCLRGSDIKRLPVEVGELTLLRLLDLRDCMELEVIPPNILSNLSHLEELYMGPRSFDKWEVEVEGVKNASLHELKHLISLELQIQDVNTFPRGLFLEKLETFKILIGGVWGWEYADIWCREFKIDLDSKIRLKDGLILKLEGIEDLWLSYLEEQDVNYFVNELVKVGPSQLKHLYIRGSHLTLNPAESNTQEESTNDMWSHEIILEDNVNSSNTLFIEKVALPNLENLELHSINVERIWQNQVAGMSCGIQNLMHLVLYNCVNLRCLFSPSIVSSFVRLQRIEIEKCRVLEELIAMDNQEERKNNIVIFPQLQYLKMYDLENLTSFCTGDLDILELPSLKELRISRCSEFMVRCTNILTKKFVDESTTILSLDDFLQRLHTMRVLQIEGSDAWLSKEMVENGMENLATLEISYCNGLKNLLTSSIAKTLVRLREMTIESCVTITEIVLAEDAAKDEVVAFSELRELKLLKMQNLTSFSTGNYVFKFPSLERLLVDDCPNMKIFSGGELSTPMLHKVHLRIWHEEHWIWVHDLNTTIKYLYLKKIGEFLQSQQFPISTPAASLNLQTELEILWYTLQLEFRNCTNDRALFERVTAPK